MSKFVGHIEPSAAPFDNAKVRNTQSENTGSAVQLLRRQHALSRRPLQFTLRSLLLCTGFVACLAWLVQFIIRTEPLGIPIVMHIWFLVLWTSVIGGAIFTENAWSYLVAGLIGVLLASPLLIDIYINDLEPIPLLAGWSTSFAFAVFANLGGAVWCMRHKYQRTAALNLMAFLFSILLVATHVGF
jgi:hypothetical protein